MYFCGVSVHYVFYDKYVKFYPSFNFSKKILKSLDSPPGAALIFGSKVDQLLQLAERGNYEVQYWRVF